MSPRRQTPLTMEYILLGFVAQEPCHGYDLFKKVSQTPGIAMIWRVKQSQLYAILDKLESEGYLSEQTQTVGNYPDRKVFSLTARGRQVFEDWSTSPVQHNYELRQEFLARLFFALQRGKGAAASLLQQQRNACAAWLVFLENQLAELPAEAVYERMVLTYRVSQARNDLDWLKQSHKLLVQQTADQPSPEN